MRGSLKQRAKGSWSIILDLGRETDPATGLSKRKQKWITHRGTRKDAEKKLTEVLGAADGGTFVEPSKMTLIAWLRSWLAKSVKPMRRPATFRCYTSIVDTHIATSTIALLPLQRLRATDLEAYYASKPAVAAASLGTHHAILHCALQKAVKDRLLTVNPAVDLERRRASKDHSQGARENCWSAIEARRVIDAAKTAGPQMAAFCFLALDTGARKSELAGLKWTDLDLDAATLTIERQLDHVVDGAPVFGPTKTDRARTVTLNAETVAKLREHKRAQAELRMRNRTTYKDFGLLFAKEPEDLTTPAAALGQPITTLSGARFARLVKAAGAKRITFHGCRHTCATLLLEAGTPVHVVAQRLGHAKASMTLDVYSHALSNQQQDAAARLGAVLHG